MNRFPRMDTGPSGRYPHARREKHPLRVSAVVFLLLLHSVLQGLVLCFGAGGHIAIESEHGVCPHMRRAAGPGADAPLRASMVSDRIQSVSCSDIPFRLDRLISGTDEWNGRHPVPAGRIALQNIETLRRYSQDRPGPWNTPRDASPLSADGTVLKC
jgi:hypothetical protein